MVTYPVFSSRVEFILWICHILNLMTTIVRMECILQLNMCFALGQASSFFHPIWLWQFPKGCKSMRKACFPALAMVKWWKPNEQWQTNDWNFRVLSKRPSSTVNSDELTKNKIHHSTPLHGCYHVPHCLVNMSEEYRPCVDKPRNHIVGFRFKPMITYYISTFCCFC